MPQAEATCGCAAGKNIQVSSIFILAAVSPPPPLLFVLAAGATVQTNVSSVKIILLGSTPAVEASLEDSTDLLMELHTEYMEKSTKTWLCHGA